MTEKTAANAEVPEVETVENEQPNAEAEKEDEVQLEEAEFSEDMLQVLNAAEELAEKYSEKQENGSILKQEYLEKSVLPLVLEGLSWIIKEHPNDPVEHLAMFLLKNGKKEEEKQAPPPVVETTARNSTRK